MNSTCPFCNAPLPATTSAPVSDRVPCPRCGEPVPASRFPIGQPAPTLTASVPNPRKRQTLFIILGGMAFIAITTLTFALMTTGIRQARHPKVKDKTKPDEVQVAKKLAEPASLSGLGYLPQDTTTVVGLHVASLFEEPVGKELLKDPRPKRIQSLTEILEKTSLSLSDVDHVAIGMSLHDKLPQVTAVVMTRAPYDSAKIEKALDPTKPAKYREGALYRIPVPLGSAKLWTADRRVLVFTWSVGATKTSDMDRVPSEPKAGLQNLTDPTRKVLTERLNKQSQIWMVGDLQNGPHADVLAPFAPKEFWQPVGLVKLFSTGITTAEDIALIGDFFTGDAKASKELQETLSKAEFAGAKSYKVEGPPPEATDASTQWVTVQVRVSAETLRTWLK